MRKVSRRHPLEPKEPIEPRLSSPTDDADDFEDDVEELSLQDEQTSAYLRNEARNERMHVRVQLPFQVVINGRRFAGHDISVSGFSTAKRPAVDGRAPVQCDLYIRCNGFRAAIPTVAQMPGERGEGQGGRFEFTEIGDPEAPIPRRLIRSHLAGTHLDRKSTRLNSSH